VRFTALPIRVIVMKLFSLGVTDEALRAKIDEKSSFLKAKFSRSRGRPSRTIFARIDNFVADYLQVKCNFTRKTAVLRF